MKSIFSALLLIAVLSATSFPLLAATPATEPGSSPTSASIAPDRLEYHTAGLALTFHRTGLVRVDYTLNQKGVSRADIESGFAGYPTEKFNEFPQEPDNVRDLFILLEKPEFPALGDEYRAPEGSFARHGHCVVMTLTVFSGATEVKKVIFDTSRQTDLPEVLNQTWNKLHEVAKAAGVVFPKGPFLD